jgi:hypothetical protein
MPATRFYAMVRANRRLRAERMSEMCDMFFIPAAKVQWMEQLRERYEYRAKSFRTGAEIARDEAKRAEMLKKPGPSHNQVINMFRVMKGETVYG